MGFARWFREGVAVCLMVLLSVAGCDRREWLRRVPGIPPSSPS